MTCISKCPRGRRLTAILLASAVFFAPSLLHADENRTDDLSLQEEIESLRERIDALEKVKKSNEPPLVVSWDGGLRFSSMDGSSVAEIKGKLQTDWFFQSGSRDLDRFVEAQGNDLHDGVEFRRTRLTLQGRIRERFLYKAAYEFSGGDAAFKDVYVGIDSLNGNILLKIGHFREPVSLEANTGEHSLRLMERSLMQNLTPSRNTGVGLFGTALEERLSWGTGIFWNTDDYGAGGEDGGLSASARITGLPWCSREDRLLHLGVSASRRGEDSIVFAADPEMHAAPDFIDTDGFVGGLSPHAVRMDAADLLGCETALALGPLSLQSEYLCARVDAPGSSDPFVWGGYIEGGYFLTGEQRRYSRKRGAFGGVTPRSSCFSDEGGLGAWEVTARFSRLDLDDPDMMNGGEMVDYSTGINWFVNPSVRVSANYIHSHLEHVGSARLFVLRFALSF